MIVERARRNPGATAAVFPDAELTYGELERARRASPGGCARAAWGRSPAWRSSPAAPRRCSPACWGSCAPGGAYVPLDPGAPAERIAFVLRDSGARVLLAEPALLDRAAGFGGRRRPAGRRRSAPRTAIPDAEPEVPPDALAYVIYTSGSTGTPKGVMVPHRALANLAHAEVELHGFGPSTRLFSTLR